MARTILGAGLALLVLLAGAGPLTAHQIKHGSLVIKHPWCMRDSGDAHAAVGFLKIVNTGDAPDRLISATFELAASTMLEASPPPGSAAAASIEGGAVIPAGATLELAPGQLHVLFLDVAKLPPVGTSVSGTLVFEKAGSVDIDYEVVSAGEEPDH